MATTHLKAKFGDLRASFRHEQSKDILKWLEAIRGGRPIILAGDLNGLPSESFFSTLICQWPGAALPVGACPSIL